MAAGSSPTSICNIGLIALGEDPITALTDNNKRAILCRARYDDIRRFVLRTHPWSCARKQAELAEDPTLPLFKWGHRYALPADFIRFYAQDDEVYDNSTWELMNGFIYSNDSSPLQVTYVYDLQDATKFDADLEHVIAYQLASELGLPLTQNSQRVKQALDMMEGKYAVSRFINAQERSPKEWDVDIWLRSRN